MQKLWRNKVLTAAAEPDELTAMNTETAVFETPKEAEDFPIEDPTAVTAEAEQLQIDVDDATADELHASEDVLDDRNTSAEADGCAIAAEDEPSALPPTGK